MNNCKVYLGGASLCSNYGQWDHLSRSMELLKPRDEYAAIQGWDLSPGYHACLLRYQQIPPYLRGSDIIYKIVLPISQRDNLESKLRMQIRELANIGQHVDKIVIHNPWVLNNYTERVIKDVDHFITDAGFPCGLTGFSIYKLCDIPSYWWKSTLDIQLPFNILDSKAYIDANTKFKFLKPRIWARSIFARGRLFDDSYLNSKYPIASAMISNLEAELNLTRLDLCFAAVLAFKPDALILGIEHPALILRAFNSMKKISDSGVLKNEILLNHLNSVASRQSLDYGRL